MRVLPTLLVIALVAAVMITFAASREAFAPQLVRLEAAVAVPEMAQVLDGESIAMNAAILQFAKEPELRLNAQLAMHRYPQLTREVLPVWSAEEQFRQALVEYGPAVIPPIAYFMAHEIDSLWAIRAAGDAVASVRQAAERLLGVGAKGGADQSANQDPQQETTAALAAQLSPADRGWQAIGLIRANGHDFLGQFVVDAEGQVEWLQTERITEAATEFFTSGIRSLETRYRLNEEPSAMDYLWAGVDLTLAAGAVKVLRLGRAATATRTGAAATRAGATSARASLMARTVVRGGRSALRVGRYGVPVAVAYAVVRHPSLISGLAAQAANVLGLSVPLVQAATWFVILLPLLWVLWLVSRWLVRPTLFVLGVATRALSRIHVASRRRATTSAQHNQRVEPTIVPTIDPTMIPAMGELTNAADHGRGRADDSADSAGKRFDDSSSLKS